MTALTPHAESVRWAELITAAWRQSVNDVIRVGELLIKAKDSLPHGEFTKMIEGNLPFKSRSAEMLMEIARDERLTNAKYAAHLPPHWTTLHELTKLPTEAWDAGIADGTINPDMKIKDITQTRKKERRAQRELDLASKQTALPEKCYGVIVADPEWQWQPWSRETGLDRAAENHYPTSCLEVIMSREVEKIAAKDCALFLWATIPMLPHALLVMAAWGFDYKSHYVWAKDKIGLGYWSREKHELLLIGTRGDIPCPSAGEQNESVIIAPRQGHSEKPECVLEMIERYFPHLPKIELNRRGPSRNGWDAWGNESTQSDVHVPPHRAPSPERAPSSLESPDGARSTFS